MYADSSNSLSKLNSNSSTLRSTGRVRTGCIVCRKRKLKCDEHRPSCGRCTRTNRNCVYRHAAPSVPLSYSTAESRQLGVQEDLPTPALDTSLTQRQEAAQPLVGQLLSPERTPNGVQPVARTPVTSTATEAAQDPQDSVAGRQPTYDESFLDMVAPAPPPDNTGSPSARFYTTSLDIYLVTTLDWLGSVSIPQSFAYFMSQVDCPFIAPFDEFNWKWVKLYLTEIAAQDASLTFAILSLQDVYRAVVNRLSTIEAVSQYQVAVDNLEHLLRNGATDFDNVVAITFLLCLCQVTLPNEDAPFFRGFGPVFETQLRAWLWTSQVSPISVRLCIWLQLLHVAAKRVGTCGIMPETMFDLLSSAINSPPSLLTLERYTKSADLMLELLSAPVFAFYMQLQRVSNQIQGLSHYRRSRTTPDDQAETAEVAARLKLEMLSIWDARPGPLRMHPNQMRQDLREAIAAPLITLTGLCITVYFVEVVALRRIIGDRPFPSPESVPALRQIRDIVDSDAWNTSTERGLNAGYMRPLFLYAIENMDRDETQWAVGLLRQVKAPMSRSEFVSSLAEAMGEAQRAEKRRVTTKYFCHQAFKVPVPLI